MVVFQRHLSDAEVDQVNSLLLNIPQQPAPCCWDGHLAVQEVSNPA